MANYEQYKNSGIDWVGNVPASWNRSRIKFLLSHSSAGVWGEDEKGDKNDIVCFRAADFDYSHGCLKLDNNTMRNIQPKQLEGRVLHKRDLLIEKSGGGDATPVGRIVRLNYDGIATCSNFMHFISVDKYNDDNYLFYYFYAMYANNVNILFFNQTTGIQNLKVSEYLGQTIFLPPLNKQSSIAKYLDKKCSEIDNVISAQQKRIALLQELKQSVITHAVTKGLNPNVEMKDSGVEWIDKIPSNWNIVRLKNDCSLKGRIGWNGLRSEEFEKESYAYLVTGQDFVSSDIDWSKCYQINKKRYDEDPCIQLENGDLLITKDGTIGKIAKVSNMDKPACLNSGIFVLKQKTRKEFVQGYLYWSLYSDLLKEFNSYTSTGTTILHLYQNVFENMPLVVPPKKEQQEISDYLDKKTKAIDLSLSKAQHQVELLQEYKQSLITEVVTGKRKVC